MNSFELRKKFFDYFEKHGHKKVESSSLIPAQDPTILFTNAGMNQFKDVLLGKETRSYKRAVTIQKCVRAGGKHNDLDNVGFTQRHLTFFEMMGNFSFGDYFKKEAIPFAWNFLTQDIGLDPQKLYVSVHHSDDEAFEIWEKDIKIPKEKIFRLGADNFWQMGDVGPCGPCTEIFVDRGPSYGCRKDDCSLPCGCDRYLEVWNVVFMQFERQADGTDVPLKQTGIDTGMGLERLAVIVQGKDSVFETDVFATCIAKTEELTGLKRSEQTGDKFAAFNVLADHVRSATFLISDGCAPANDGRGYVLRKIIRRAALFAQKLTKKNIFPELSQALISYMAPIYPDLLVNQERIVSVLTTEIERFADNLQRGKTILENYIAKQSTQKIVSGEQAFMLYDTYGFPLEVVQLIAQEHGFAVDTQGFADHMQQQKERSGKKMRTTSAGLSFDESMTTEFTGYSSRAEQSSVQALVVNDQFADSVAAGQECWFVPTLTPFYVECGGQVNDKGVVEFAGQKTALLDLKKVDKVILVKIVAPCSVKVGDAVTMYVDDYFREHTMKNHTATHLLQAALQEIFGKQVKQAGSVVTQDYLRFDYTYHKPLTEAQIKQIEDLVNKKIWENIAVSVEYMTLKNATDRGIIAFFGDKYNPDEVRAILIPGFSAELCGGTHVARTGDIGCFKIVEETALAAGQRRMVAYTGGKALAQFQQDFALVQDLAFQLKAQPHALVDATTKLQAIVKELQKEVKLLKKEQWKSQLPVWAQAVQKYGSVFFAKLVVVGYDNDDVVDIAHALQTKQEGLYIVINKQEENKVQFVASLGKNLANKVDMKIVKQMLQEQYGLRGGGSGTNLQGGGMMPADEGFTQLTAWLTTL